jgi:precorrin-6B methylase 2
MTGASGLTLVMNSLHASAHEPSAMTPSEALAFVKRHGVVLQAARGPVPSLAEAVAGSPIRGSWWGHPKGREIYGAAQAVVDSADVLVCRLVDGKVTFVHRRLWPALVRLARRFRKAQLARVWDEHTPSGAHRSRRLRFPVWVPADVMRQAEALSVEDAERILSPWLPVLTGPASRRAGPPRAGALLAIAALASGVALSGMPDAAVTTAQDRPSRTPDIHFTPTRHEIVEAMLRLAQVTKDDIVYDLGSGDGRIVIVAAQRYGARGVGIEIDPSLVARAWQNARDAGVIGRVAFVVGDLFEADLSEATVVTLYLSASINARLLPKLRAELGPGARIVSHQFRLGDWRPDEQIRADSAEVFLWRIPGPPPNPW